MQNIANKIAKDFQDFEKFLKLKFGKKQKISQYIMFKDFFRCERPAKVLGYTFLKNDITPSNKWLKFNSFALHVAIIVILMTELISFVLSIQQKSFHVTMENVLVFGGYVIAGSKLFIIFHYKRAKIDEVIEKLDRHFPYFGVD
ncbi:unnamed protein product [Chironomus riparius]|uniref:Uncharacterized protein n=1 Tax=Chironomus riparius TaxID=315576 RepID=A0A9N9WWE4_9DIPT|nr:unnamed protein product [Chironomus riparius]